MADESNPAGGTSAAAEPLTAEQVAAIVNSAITNRLKREPNVKELIAEAFANYKPPVTTPPQDETPPKGGKRMDPELAAVMAQLEDHKKAAREAVDRQLAAEKAQREYRAMADLRAALVGKVRPEAIDMVAKHLMISEKRVTINEDGTATIKTQLEKIKGFPEEVDLPLEAGVGEWLKTDVAKMFVPAPQAQTQQSPQGQRGSRMPQPAQGKLELPKYEGEATTDEEKVRRAYEQEQILSRQGFG
jgi:hypothetical protein